jgi:hypothetical protein
MTLNEIVKMAFTNIPETIGNNDLLYYEVCRVLCEIEGITTAEEFLRGILNKTIPSSHTLAATISTVRKTNPEFIPTEEQLVNKLNARQRYIDEYINS